MQPFSGPLSRRTLTRGAAWSIPVIMTAAAAPAMATSPVPVEPVDNTCDGCKWPGEGSDPPHNKAFRATICWKNNGSTLYTVNITSTSISGSGCPREIAYDEQTFTVAPGETVCQYIYFRADSSGNRDFTLTYSIVEIPGSSYSDTINLGFSSSCRKQDPVPYTGDVTPCPTP